ncbi:MAG: J domain-containing protein [Synechococcales cyanobacterium CRU_2_2]|nr:J domain-containing protein [Synechococcales cyanobacterium CRU_2_2]
METRLCYQVLELHPGIAPGLSQAELRQAYRDLVQVWHPDRFSHNPRLRAKAELKLAQLNDAYGTLKPLLVQRDRIQASFRSPVSPASGPSVSSRVDGNRANQTRPDPTSPQDSPQADPAFRRPEANFPRHYPASNTYRSPFPLRWYFTTLGMTVAVILLLFTPFVFAYFVAQQPGLFLIPAVAFISLYGYRNLGVR